MPDRRNHQDSQVASGRRTARQRGSADLHNGPSQEHMGLEEEARAASVEALGQIQADLAALRGLYKHFHWRLAGPRFYMLHKLYDKHAEQASEQIDEVAERMQMLGGGATAWPGDIAEMTRVRPPEGDASDPEYQLRALLEAHETILREAHEAADRADDAGDAGTSDLLAADVIRKGQMQAWFIGQHLDYVAER